MTSHPNSSIERPDERSPRATKYYATVELNFEADDWVREYAENVTPILHRHGGRYLARTNVMERVEGDRDLPTLFVILEWPSKQAFDRFFADPEYQKYKQLRRDNAGGELIMIAGEDIAVNLGYVADVAEPTQATGAA